MDRRTFLAASSSLALSPWLSSKGSGSVSSLCTSSAADTRSLLQHYCTNESLRYDLRTPFAVDGYVYATDGRSAIRIRDADWEPPSKDRFIPSSMEYLFREGHDAIEPDWWFDFQLASLDQLETDGSIEYIGTCPLCTRRSIEQAPIESECELCQSKPYHGPDLQRVGVCLIRYVDAVRISRIPGIQICTRHQRYFGPEDCFEERTYTPISFRGSNHVEGLIQPVPFPREVIERAKARNKPASIPTLPAFDWKDPESDPSDSYSQDSDFPEDEFGDFQFDFKNETEVNGGPF